MKRKIRLKQSASNEFQRITGIKTIQLTGSSNCLIVEQKSYKSNYSIQQYAYFVYNKNQDNSKIKVSTTCGVDQCIKEDHLVSIYKPLKNDIQYIKENLSFGTDHLAHMFKVPEDLLKRYLDS